MSDDRTAEFLSLARSLPGGASSASSSYRQISSSGQNALQQHDSSNASNKNSSNSNPAYAELRSFHQTAAGISKDIAGTSALLSELTMLVRNQSSSSLLLYQDAQHNARINDLVVRIKTSIENLNFRLDQAATTIAQQKRKLPQHSQAGQEVSNLVDGLKTEFAQAASGFKKVLQQRTDTMKESDLLQKQVYGKDGSSASGDDEDDMMIPNLSLAPPPVFASSTSASFGAGAGHHHQQQQSFGSFPTMDLTSGMMATGQDTNSALPRPHGISSAPDSGGGGMRNRRLQEYSGGYSTHHPNSGSHLYNGSGSGGHVMTPLDIARMEQEMSANGDQTMQLIPDHSYLQQRADTMSTVEASIVELGTMFNKLAVIVSEHQELVQRVEDNVDDANTNVNLSLAVLTDTLMNLRSNKQLALRLFSVLVVFIIMFIIFFA